MSFTSWKTLQDTWKQERQDRHLKEEASTTLEMHNLSTPPLTKYVVVDVHVASDIFFFKDYPNNQVKLVRGYNYIFDLSHPSNRGHQLVFSRNPRCGKVNGLTFQGTPGEVGSFISFYVGDGRPETLYYYCAEMEGAMNGTVQVAHSMYN